MIMFSIIMPTYNRGYIIENAIASVINQTYQSWELIIVDDGSIDNTLEVVSNVADNRVQYIRCEENAGANHARNIGIGKASGKYLAFLDSDNQWRKNYLESQFNVLENEEISADVVFARCLHAMPWGYNIFPNNLYTELSSDEKIIKCALHNSVFDTNVVCMKRVIWEESERFDENLFRFQDWEYFLRILVEGKYRFKFNNEVLCDNYLQQDSISFNKEIFWDARLYILEKYIEKCREMDEVTNIVMKLLKQPAVDCILPSHVEKLRNILSLDEVTELCKKYYAENTEYCTNYMLNVEEKRGQAEFALKLAEKNDRILQIERKWIILKQKNKSVASIFTKQDVFNIAIYGYGVLGQLLFQELKGTNVAVRYIIDREKRVLEEDYPTTIVETEYIEQIKKSIDAIVVTAIAEYVSIKQYLQSHIKIKIISIEEIMDIEV